MEGHIVPTGRALVLLGDGYFADVTTQDAAAIVQRRRASDRVH